MGQTTRIAWTDHTFNPFIGCQKISPGCKNCYAETFIDGRMGKSNWGGGHEGYRERTKSPWVNVKRWNKQAVDHVGCLGAGMPDLCFTLSLGDMFEDNRLVNSWRGEVWDVIRVCRNMHFQVLTKRPERIPECLPADWGEGWSNVWLGTSIENQDLHGDLTLCGMFRQ